MPEPTDVVVIGGGTTGCAIAWHLARARVGVRLIERTRVGAGSSGASPGIVRQYYADPALVALASAGLDVYRSWSDIVGGDCGYQRTGFLTAVASTDEFSARARVQQLCAEGFAFEWRSPDDLRKLGTDVNVAGLAGAVFEPDAGHCDAHATARAFANAALTYGAKIDEDCAVRQIRHQGGRVTGVDTERGQIDCEVVVNAAGPWASGLAATCGAPLPIVATRQSVSIVQVNEDLPLPGFSDRVTGFYLRPHEHGQYFIGSLSTDDTCSIDPDKFARAMSDDDASRYRERAALRFTRFLGAKHVGSRVSFFDDTPDGNPLFGPDPRMDCMFVAAGLSGHGFKFAPVFGEAVVQWLQTGQMRSELHTFDVARLLR